MNRPLSDYVALAFLADVSDESDIFNQKPKEHTGTWEELKEKAEDTLGFEITDEVFNSAIRSLGDCGLVRITDDQYSGEYIKIYVDRTEDLFKRADEENKEAVENLDQLGVLNKPSDYPAAHALLKHELFEDYKELGDKWLKRALLGLREKVEKGEALESSDASSLQEHTIPASDRTVTLNDNMAREFDDKTTEIISAVERENRIEGEEGLREVIVGQLKAGRELIRAGSFRLYVAQVTLLEALAFLAKRYEREAIGAMAAALLTALTNHFGL
jgi:hypothetical protein